jgi:metal-responsive CopG/Arc/MetJ family transcriptional regulator
MGKMTKKDEEVIGLKIEKRMIEDIVNLQKKYAIFNRSEMMRKIINKGINKIENEGL